MEEDQKVQAVRRRTRADQGRSRLYRAAGSALCGERRALPARPLHQRAGRHARRHRRHLRRLRRPRWSPCATIRSNRSTSSRRNSASRRDRRCFRTRLRSASSTPPSTVRARALSKAGESLDRIASAVFRAKGDQSSRNRIYSDTLSALGREDEKISNLRESMVSVERLLLFLIGEGGAERYAQARARGDEDGAARPAIARGGRKLQGAEGAVPARRDARPHQSRAERHHQALLGACGHLHAPDRHRLDLRHEFQG